MTCNGSGGRVLVYRNELLPVSETFIRAQTLALRRYEPYFVGFRRIAGLDLPAAKTIVVDSGDLLGFCSEAAFKVTVRPPAALLDKLMRLQPVLVHAHFAYDAYWALPIAAGLKIPLLVTLHGYDVTIRAEVFERRWNPLSRIHPTRRRRLFSEADRFIAVSNFILESAVAAGCPRSKLSVHYTGIDDTQFHPPAASASRKTVLFVGRLVEKKGCEHLLRAMVQVQKLHPDTEVLVVGDGPLRGALERFAMKNLRSCHFLGAQPASVVMQRIGESAVFCVPSIVAANGDAEGFGMVFLEAQACAVPVVSYATGGIPEAVQHGESGLLVRPGDVAALAAAIGSLLESDALMKRMGSAGRRRVEQHFTLAKQTEQLESIYDSVIASHASGRDAV